MTGYVSDNQSSSFEQQAQNAVNLRRELHFSPLKSCPDQHRDMKLGGWPKGARRLIERLGIETVADLHLLLTLGDSNGPFNLKGCGVMQNFDSGRELLSGRFGRDDSVGDLCHPKRIETVRSGEGLGRGFRLKTRLFGPWP